MIDTAVTRKTIKLIYGVGINDADYKIKTISDGKTVICPYYAKWRSMIERCYSASFQERQPTYKGCTVCDDWLYFSNFKKWMSTNRWKGLELDKDMLSIGNKFYSPLTCMFIPKWANVLLNENKARNGKYLQGTYFCNRREKFVSQITINGKRKHLGYYDTTELAASSYNLAKSNYIREIIATKEEVILNNRLKQALIRHADRFFELHLKYKGL